jgi:predicted deacylase
MKFLKYKLVKPFRSGDVLKEIAKRNKTVFKSIETDIRPDGDYDVTVISRHYDSIENLLRERGVVFEEVEL